MCEAVGLERVMIITQCTLKFCIINKHSSFGFEVVSLDVITEKAALSLFGGVDKVRDSWGFDSGMKSKLYFFFFFGVHVLFFRQFFLEGILGKVQSMKWNFYKKNK